MSRICQLSSYSEYEHDDDEVDDDYDAYSSFLRHGHERDQEKKKRMPLRGYLSKQKKEKTKKTSRRRETPRNHWSSVVAEEASNSPRRNDSSIDLIH